MNDPTVVELLRGAPFIVQERLTVVRHLRVVTVCEQAWTFEFSAPELPLDWRENLTAHSSWKYTTLPKIERRAVDLSTAMAIRYSSQDWIETTGGTYFIDLNPGGQWLFLPDPQATQISVTISEWLQAANESG